MVTLLVGRQKRHPAYKKTELWYAGGGDQPGSLHVMEFWLLPRAGSGVVIIDQLHFLAGCRTRRINQALSVSVCLSVRHRHS